MAAWRRFWASISFDGNETSLIEELQLILDVNGFMAVTFVNPAAYKRALESNEYLNLLENHDYVLCDGIGVIWAAKMIWGARVRRIAFDTTSLAPYVFRLAQEKSIPVALIGGRDGVAKTAAERLREAFPGLIIVAARNGYFGNMVDARTWAESTAARIIICGMGVPMQERFSNSLREGRWTGAVFTCGGYLDQLGKGMDYYPAWINSLNLRFLYRLYKEPRRLAKRYLYDYMWFVTLTIRAVINTRLSKREE